MSNMNCSSQKANSKDWNDNYSRIFKKQFFDVIDDIDEILEEANTMEEKRTVHYCKLCNEYVWVACSKIEWKELYGGICDSCASKLWEVRT